MPCGRIGARGSTTISAAEQWARFDAFIKQDSYLSKNRGKIAQRFGLVNPWYSNVDVRVLQDVALTRMGGYLRSLRAFQVEAVADERARANPHGVGSEMPWGERHAVDTLRPSSARTR